MLEGTVVNGVIVLDGGLQLQEGVRVQVEVLDPDDLAPPVEPYDREKELAILREALEDVRAGRGIPLEELMAQVTAAPESDGETIMLEGTVVNGVIVLDGGLQLQEGVRVQVEVVDPDDLAPPVEPYDRENELAILRESLEDAKAGRTRPLDEVVTEIAARYHLPPVSEE